MAFIIQDREAGNRIDEFATLEQAQNALAKYEETDKAEGTYAPDFYEIVEQENTFYYFEGRIYQTKAQVEKATKNYTNQKYDEIITSKTFNDFDDEFDKLKAEGNSDLDAIEWAK